MRLGSILSRAALGYLPALLIGMTPAIADPSSWRQEWPRTDFSRHSVAYDEIVSGGPSKDGIPAIDNPSFAPVSEVRGVAPHAPVISVAVGGECIVGMLLGSELKLVPMRVEAFDRFASRFPQGRVLLPRARSQRAYGRNPYGSYDSAASPFLYRGKYAGPVAPLARVVVVGEEAWTLDLVNKRRRIEAGDLVLTWEPGQASPLDTADIDAGQDIGNVVVQRRTAKGLEDAVYDVSFAFAFRAFHPQAPIHAE